MQSKRIPRWVLAAVYIPPLASLAAELLRSAVADANPDLPVVVFMLFEQGLPALGIALHLVGLAVLTWESIARARSGLAPTWSLVPAFVYYSLIILFAFTLRGDAGRSVIWAI